MKKELEDAMKALDTLNLELEHIKSVLVQKPLINKSSLSNKDFESALRNLQNENDFLKQQLSEHKDFLNSVLENIEDVFVSIKELRNDE